MPPCSTLIQNAAPLNPSCLAAGVMLLLVWGWSVMQLHPGRHHARDTQSNLQAPGHASIAKGMMKFIYDPKPAGLAHVCHLTAVTPTCLSHMQCQPACQAPAIGHCCCQHHQVEKTANAMPHAKLFVQGLNAHIVIAGLVLLVLNFIPACPQQHKQPIVRASEGTSHRRQADQWLLGAQGNFVV